MFSIQEENMSSIQEEKMYIVKDMLKSDVVFIFYNFKYFLLFQNTA